MSSLTQNFDSTNQVTMSSIEIVDFINNFASNWLNTILRHDHFMVKVPKY
jgi:hypothetical protein